MDDRPAPNDPEWIPWHRMQPAHVDALAARLGGGHLPATSNVTLAAVRGVHKGGGATRLENTPPTVRHFVSRGTAGAVRRRPGRSLLGSR
jgi:hypothetical protein